MKSKITDQRVISFALIFFLLLILGGIFFHRPFWGLMDDSSYVLQLIPEMKAEGIWQTAWKYGIDDLSWGMFRPTLPLMAYVVYVPGIYFGPEYTYAWNAVLVALILLFYSDTLGKILNIRGSLILLCTACFFYQYDLFQFPSLQEKMLLATGAMFLRLCLRWWDLSIPRRVLLAAVLMLVGAAIKASIVIHFSMGVWILFAGVMNNPKGKSAKDLISVASVVLGLVVVVFFNLMIAKNGGYTGRYKLGNIYSNLNSKEGAMFATCILSFLVTICFKIRFYIGNLILLTPLVGVCAFLVVFLPWGIQGYLQTNVGAILCSLVVFVLDKIFREKYEFIWVLGMMFLGSLICSYRSYSMFKRFADIRSILNELGNMETTNGLKNIWMPCMEGADSMERYVHKIFHGNISFKQFKSRWEPAEGYVLYDSSLCRLPESIGGTRKCNLLEDYLYKSSWERSFRIQKFTCSTNENPKIEDTGY